MKRECQCPTVQHEHGTALAYNKDKCRCEPCREARSREGKRQRLNRHRRDIAGRTSYSDATESAARIRLMSKRGMHMQGIADLCGISLRTVRRLLSEDAKTVTTEVHDLIMCAPLPIVPQFDSARIDVTGTQRRLRALVAIGYTYKRLGEVLDMHQSNARSLTTGDWKDKHHKSLYVTVRIRDRVAAVYDELWNTPPVTVGWREEFDARAARERAAAAGWALPMDLDDDRLDDPEYRPIRTYRKDAA